MTVDVSFDFILVYLLVFVRLMGMIVLNPLLARTNIPGTVRNGLALFLTLLIAPLQGPEVAAAVYGMDGFLYVVAVVRELAIGAVFGFIFQIFYYLLYFAGDMVDTDIGLSMAKNFDPATSIQAGFAGSLFTILFVLYILLTGSFHTLLHIFSDTFKFIPVGNFTLNMGILSYCLRFFTEVFSLILRLVAPFMVAEVIMQGALGILMRFVPQISVFVINFPMRIILGIIMLYVFAPYIGQFIDTYIDTMFGGLIQAADMLAAA